MAYCSGLLERRFSRVVLPVELIIERERKILETVADLQFQVQGWEIDKFGINWNLILPILRFWIIGIEPRRWKIHIVKCFFFLTVNRQVKNFKIQNLEISNDTERMMIPSTHFSFNVQLEKLYPTFSELSSRKSHKGTFVYEFCFRLCCTLGLIAASWQRRQGTQITTKLMH